jgi:uncharacterized protein (TIGR02246 family)
MTTTTGARPVATAPEQVHQLFQAFVNAGDADGLASLFEPDGLMVPAPGVEARGAAQLSAACAQLCDMGARFELRTDAVRTAGDLALLSNSWHATTPDGSAFGGRTTEVVRRQPDGRWLAVIDDPNWIA